MSMRYVISVSQPFLEAHPYAVARYLGDGQSGVVLNRFSTVKAALDTANFLRRIMHKNLCVVKNGEILSRAYIDRDKPLTNRSMWCRN